MTRKMFAGAALILSGLTALPAGAAAQPSGANPQGDPPTITVSYSDLNLATPAGRDALDGRVRRAAETLCVEQGVKSLQSEAFARKCVGDALAGAGGQIRQAVADFSTDRYASRGSIQLARK